MPSASGERISEIDALHDSCRYRHDRCRGCISRTIGVPVLTSSAFGAFDGANSTRVGSVTDCADAAVAIVSINRDATIPWRMFAKCPDIEALEDPGYARTVVQDRGRLCHDKKIDENLSVRKLISGDPGNRPGGAASILLLG